MNKTETAAMELILKAEKAQAKAQQELSLSLLMAGQIDEVSLLFATESQLDLFIKAAKKLGMENFNSVTDTLERQDEGGCFGVRFEFLRWPGSDWRIEAMCVAGSVASTDLSIAPLHSAALERNGWEPVVVHASFKVGTEGEYVGVAAVMAQQFDNVGGMRAEYRNTYGRFSYFGDGTSYYFKPRVNLRDA